MRLSDEVRTALDAGNPVVALESTLITHGLPRPLNLETAQAMESEVRSAGAIPATIALLDGAIHVGLDQGELERLAAVEDALKISSRGLAYAVASGRNAGTTVAATMWIARRAGIDYFATGGIGGVHHGASETGDISADLIELSRTRVAVVCAGVKSILDIGRTLEYLETAGIPVFGFGTDAFPAFFSGLSGYPAPYRLEDADQAARVFHAHRDMGFSSGMLIACPPPVPVEDQESLTSAIEQANRETRERGVRSGDVTPYVLQRVAELSDGASMRVNIELLKNNARVAAEIAVADAKASMEIKRRLSL